jgi:hypothetical protein
MRLLDEVALVALFQPLLVLLIAAFAFRFNALLMHVVVCEVVDRVPSDAAGSASCGSIAEPHSVTSSSLAIVGSLTVVVWQAKTVAGQVYVFFTTHDTANDSIRTSFP